ncbi:MAG: polymer-forming cytoskeletal protein [Bacteroidota bacterium]
MFKSATKTDATPSIQATSSLSATNATCMIAKGTTIEGKFTSKEDAQINGTIKGEVFCKSRLLMGPTGLIEGTVRTQSAIIKGYVKGTIIVQGLLKLESTAKVEGIILAKDLQVESGAQYDGECKIGERFVKEEMPKAAVA